MTAANHETLTSSNSNPLTFRELLDWLQRESAYVDLDAPLALRVTDDEGGTALGWVVRADYVDYDDFVTSGLGSGLSCRGMATGGVGLVVLDAVDDSVSVSSWEGSGGGGNGVVPDPCGGAVGRAGALLDRVAGLGVPVERGSGYGLDHPFASTLTDGPVDSDLDAAASGSIASAVPGAGLRMDDVAMYTAMYTVQIGSLASLLQVNDLSPSAVDAALAQARASTCAKSRRGAAAFLAFDSDGVAIALSNRVVVGAGNNGLPCGIPACQGDDSCRSSCRYRAVHAEERAVSAAMVTLGDPDRGHGDDFFDVVHVKVDAAGDLVAGGGPSCWQCARTMIECGSVAGVWLFEDRGDRGACWVRYPIRRFYEVSMRDARIP